MNGKVFFLVFVSLSLIVTGAVHAGKISEWKFDGNGNDSMAVQTATTVGAAVFNGTGGISGGFAYVPNGASSININYNAAYDRTSNFTVEFWFRQRANKGFRQDLVYKGLATYNWRIFRELYDGSANFGEVKAGYTDSVPNWKQVSNANQLSHNVWHHVAYTNGASGHAYYLDGQLIHSAADTNPAQTPAQPITVGDTADDTDFDELRIWDYARSQSEIETYYRSLTPPLFISGYPKVENIESTKVDLLNKIDENGKAYFVVLYNAATPPTSAEVKAGTGSGGAAPVNSGNIALTGSVAGRSTITGLMLDTAYDIYVVAEDNEASPNLQPNPVKLDVKTATAVSVVIPAGSTVQAFEAVSVPLEAPDPSATAVLGPQIGTYDTTKNRVGRWSPSLGAYLEYPNMSSLLPGHTFWFLSRAGQTLRFVGLPAPLTPDPTETDAVEVLLEQGWNQVGNPHLSTINVSEITVKDDITTNWEYLTSPTYNITQGIFWIYVNGEYFSASTLGVTAGGWVKKLTPGTGKIYFREIAADPRADAHTSYDEAPDYVERPPAPPASGDSWSGGGGGGGGGGCFIHSLFD